MAERPVIPIRVQDASGPAGAGPGAWLQRLRRRLMGGWPAASARDAEAPPGFCAAPWVEAVIRIDGNVLPCCRNEYRYGSIQDAPLESIWNSGQARGFRESIARGAFPNPACGHCYRKGKATTLASAFESLLGQLWQRHAQACEAEGAAPDAQLCRLVSEFHAGIAAGATTRRMRRVCGELEAHATRASKQPGAGTALAKIAVIARASLDYLERRVEPRIVATLRQANLVAVCNARCVHCIGLYTEEIVRGEDVGGRRLKRMPEAQSLRALGRADDMTSFFMNGSEFLLHPQWRPMVSTLAASGVRLSMATNAMLLDPRATDFLLDSGVLLEINFSFDGARAETIERIRVKVRYDTLIAHLRHFLDRQAQARAQVPICISMVLMRSNVGECAELVRLVDSLRASRDLRIHVSFELLEHSGSEAYMQFFAREWIDIRDAAAHARLQEAAAAGTALGLRTLYSGEALADAVARVPAAAAA